MIYEKPVCKKCGRKTVYFRKNGTVRCTACGYDSADEKEKK